jgi:Sec-independent protein translocase protein TatA
MDILGIGGAELVLIVLVMLVVAGPKRMIQWAYIAGKYAGQARRLWQETAEKLQAELDGAGVDVKVPRKMQLPTGAASGADAQPHRPGCPAGPRDRA